MCVTRREQISILGQSVRWICPGSYSGHLNMVLESHMANYASEFITMIGLHVEM